MPTQDEMYARFGQSVKEAHGELDQAGGERALVLVSFALVDQAITSTLESFLADGKDKDTLLDAANGALGLFATRVRLCTALGLLPLSHAKAALSLAKIRNPYAHRTNPTFDQVALSNLASAEAAMKIVGSETLPPGDRYRHVAGWLAARIAVLWTDEKLNEKRSIHPENF